MPLLSRAERWDFEIDKYLNRIIPASPLHRLPAPVSRFLGYRKEDKPDVGNVLAAFYSFLGAFCGLAVVAAVFNNVESIRAKHPPALIASFGASAILEYNTLRSPLGQPRNALLGHTFSALVGVGVTKLFLLHHQPADFEPMRWIAGAVACGLASAVMLLTGTVHPPGGASAVLAATSPEITEMGWFFVGLVMLGSVLMLGVGLVVNNIQRRFPVYWWTPLEVGRRRRRDGSEEEVRADGKGGLEFADEEGCEKRREGLALNSEEARLLEALRKRLRRAEAEVEESAETARSSAEVTRVPSHCAGSDRSAV
ncbi:hypothetical protein CC80DRAFT_515770 [Byssothecium circinans]|uniref:HPP transmembrane region domain-containing protein n=1 Tax=Byssothecium circinans TaxID=147558 RepID=A0A6A5TZ85_9PLEO|nr:hypothetical protein CC80DRAFT_515770 [Byssothecium circinans]